MGEVPDGRDGPESEDYVGTSGAGRLAGLSAERIRQLAAEGKLASTKTAIGRLYKVADVEQLAKTREGGRARR